MGLTCAKQRGTAPAPPHDAVRGAHLGTDESDDTVWSPAELAAQARRWGFAHQLLLSERTHRFNLALLSMEPLVRVAAAKPGDVPYFHGALCASLPPTHARLVVCVTHLTPHAPHKRRAEALALRRTLLPAAQAAAAKLDSTNHDGGRQRARARAPPRPSRA